MSAQGCLQARHQAPCTALSTDLPSWSLQAGEVTPWEK